MTLLAKPGILLLLLASLCKAHAEDFTAHWEKIWTDFHHHYSYFELKGINWTNTLEQKRPLFADTTATDFARNLSDILQTLKDWHVTVQQGGTTRGYQGTFQQNAPPRLIAPYAMNRSYANLHNANIIFHARLTNNAAHIVVTTLDNTLWNVITDDDLTSIMATHQDASGIILDLRYNTGGNELNARRLAGHFALEPLTYGFTRTRIPASIPYAFTPTQAKQLQPVRTGKFTGAVIGLVGQRTMSSGEAFALMVKSLPNGLLLGDRTRGASANPVLKTLPELDLQYTISTWIALDEQGKPFEGTGIEPAISIPPEKSFTSTRDFVLEEAMALINWPEKFNLLQYPLKRHTDLDQDRFADLSEYVAGTDPTLPSSRLVLEWSFQEAQLRLRWKSEFGRRYSIYEADGLASPLKIAATNILATPPENSFVPVLNTKSGLYLLTVEK